MYILAGVRLDTVAVTVPTVPVAAARYRVIVVPLRTTATRYQVPVDVAKPAVSVLGDCANMIAVLVLSNPAYCHVDAEVPVEAGRSQNALYEPARVVVRYTHIVQV